MSSQFEFTQDWFGPYEPIWTEVFRRLLPAANKMLEIGSYEGRSATWLIGNALADHGRLYCIDTWAGGIEHDPSSMGAVEARFDRNIAIAKAHKPGVKVEKIKSPSDRSLQIGEGLRPILIGVLSGLAGIVVLCASIADAVARCFRRLFDLVEASLRGICRFLHRRLEP